MRNGATIVFVMSHACPLKCNFCCHSREVVGNARITASMVEDWMRRFASEPSVERFCFTGGEPFLYLRDIKQALAGARAAGVRQPFHIVTAARWAKDEAQVRGVLSELEALGMDHMGVSYDHEHAKWVTPEQIMTVMKVAAELSIGVNLSGVFWNLNESVSELLPVDDLPGKVRVTNYLAAPAGRAKSATQWPRRYDVPEERKYTCGKPGYYDIAIYPNGEVYPCCAGGLNIEAELSCGNLNRDTAAEILDTVFGNFHVRMVKEFGWGVLYKLIEQEAPELAAELPRIGDADSSCEICRDLNVNLADKLRPIYSLVEAEYARTVAEHEWQVLSGLRGPAHRRRFGSRHVTLAELLGILTEDRSARLSYLRGRTNIGVRQLGAATSTPQSGLPRFRELGTATPREERGVARVRHPAVS